MTHNAKKQIAKNEEKCYNKRIMPKFKEKDKTQGLLLAVNLQDQIVPGTFEWTTY